MLVPTDIVGGAYYAIAQAGELLHDAALLYENRRWASCLVLAVFALEELGKAEKLLERAIDSEKTGGRSSKEVMNGLTTHLIKLRSGRGAESITVGISFSGDLPEAGTAEMREIERRLDEANRTALQNAPSEAHQARMHALYVDLDEEEWRTPYEITASEAYQMLAAASVEYDVRCQKYRNPPEGLLRRALSNLLPGTPVLREAPVVKWPQRVTGDLSIKRL